MRWDFSRRNAYFLIDAAVVVENVNQGSQIPAPENERQARPLARLEPDKQREAWQKAVEVKISGFDLFPFFAKSLPALF